MKIGGITMVKEKKDSKLAIAITVINGHAEIKAQLKDCNPGDISLAITNLEIIKERLIEAFKNAAQGKKS